MGGAWTGQEPLGRDMRQDSRSQEETEQEDMEDGTGGPGIGHEVPGGDMRWDTRHQDETGSAGMEYRERGWDSRHWDGTGGVKRRQNVSG